MKDNIKQMEVGLTKASSLSSGKVRSPITR
jgi:hypothetical protein